MLIKDMPKKRLSSLSQAMEGLFETESSPLKTPFRLWQLWHSWQDIFSDKVFCNTLPINYKEGVLFVWVPHASQMQDLIFLRDQIQEKVNNFFKDSSWVIEVRLTLDRKEVPKKGENQDLPPFVSTAKEES